MPDGPLVFVDVDTQRDFLEPDGALYVAGSEAILPNLARLTACARARGIPVLATACAHTLDQPDPEPFPPHCLLGTRGQERVEATAWPGGRVLGHDEPLQPAEGLPPHLTLQKRRYDPFSHPDAERIVALYARTHPTFVVYGVATDYCVRAAVEGLLGRGRRVALVVDAVRAVDARQEPDLLTEFARRGAVLTQTEVVCGEAGGSA
jgi:nicotinamidase/pyrazinamidase